VKYSEIAERSGHSITKVQKDSQRGKFDKDDLKSVEAYCIRDGNCLPVCECGNAVIMETARTPRNNAEPAKGSSADLLTMPVGTMYRGYKHLVVEVCEDRRGKFLKLFPVSGNYPMRTRGDRDEIIATFKRVFG